MSIKKWFKRPFVRRQKSITMSDGEVLYKRAIPEIISIGEVSENPHEDENIFYFNLFLVHNYSRVWRSKDRDFLESERTRLIEWVDSWK